MKKQRSRKYFSGIHNYEQITGSKYVPSKFNSDPNLYLDNSLVMSLFENYTEQPVEVPDDRGFFSKVFDGMKGWVSEKTSDFIFGITHPSSIYNSFQERIILTNLTSNENELEHINDNIRVLGGVLEYINQINELRSLSEQYRQSTDPQQSELLEVKMRDLTQSIMASQNEYKTTGKKSPIIVDLFYDPNKSDMKWYEGIQNATGTWEEIDSELNPITNTFNILGNLWNAGEEGFGKLLPESIGGYPSGHYTKKWIGRTSPDDRSTDRWFTSFTENGGENIGKLQERVNKYLSYYNRDKKSVELLTRTNLALLLHGSWFFNPYNIDPKFKENLDKRLYGLLGFLDPTNMPYSLSELGSSFGSMENMIAQVALDAAIGTLAKTIATKANPYIGGITTASEAIEGLTRAQKAANFAKNVNLAGGALSTSSSIYFTKLMRRWETNAEAMDAYSSRLLNEAMKKNIDLNSVYLNSDLYLNRIGIPTDGLDDIQKIQLNLAFNAPSGNDEFENLKLDARKGLAKVINDNNALAFMDYIQVLPFMNYTKSFLRDFGNREWRKTLTRQYQDEWIAGDRQLREAIDPSLRAIVDSKIDKIANKWIKNPVNRLKLSHGSRFFTKKAQQLFPMMTKEGIEEGQQYLLQQRFGRGEYDDYDVPESMFYLPSSVSIAGLAADATASYLGINFGDPDNGDEELRRAMEIGAMTAMWFRAPHVLTNIGSRKFNETVNKWSLGILGDTEGQNVRGLFRQFKNDNVIKKLIGDNHGAVLDEEHVGIFFDAFSKNAADISRLRIALEDMHKFKGLGVTDEDIDRDIRLMNATWRLYNSGVTEQLSDKLGIKKNDSAHKNLIQIGARRINKVSEMIPVRNKDTEELTYERDSFINKIIDLLDKEDSDIELSVGPDQELYKIAKAISEEYDLLQNFRVHQYNEYTASKLAVIDAKRALRQAGVEELGGDDVIKEYTLELISEQIKKNAEEKYNYSREEYVRKQIESIIDYQNLIESRKLHDIYKDYEQFHKLLRDEFGINSTPEKLLGVLHYLEIIMSELNDAAKHNVEIRNYINKALEKPEDDDEESANNPIGLKLPESLTNAIRKNLIDAAIFSVENTAARAYLFGREDPNFLRATQRRPSWKNLTKEQKDLYSEDYRNKSGKLNAHEQEIAAAYNKEIRDYYKHMNDLRKEYNQIKSSYEVLNEMSDEDRHRMQEIEEEAATEFIRQELITKIDRKKIAQKEQFDERDVTPDDVSAVADGNEQAADKIKQVSAEEDSTKQQDLDTGESGQVDTGENTKSVQVVQDDGESKNATVEDSKKQVLVNPESKLVEVDLGESKHVQISEAEKELRKIFAPEDPDEKLVLPKPSKKLVQADSLEEGRLMQLEEDKSVSSDDTNDSFGGADLSKRKQYCIKDTLESDYLSETFFYLHTADKPPYINVDKIPVKFRRGGTLKSGKELSEKLVLPGWFLKTEKYYIVSGNKTKNIDDLSVALIIQDGNDVYATFLKSPTRKDKDGKTISDKLLEKNISPEFLGNSEEAIKKRYNARIDAIRRVFLREKPNEVLPADREEYVKMLNLFYASTSSDIRDDIDDIARSMMANGKKIHTKRHVSEQIEALRETRKLIVDAYTTTDKDGYYILLAEGYKTILPLNVSISNGNIAVQINNDGTHVYRNLTDGGFGMSSDIVELSRQIDSDQVLLGLGVGKSTSDPENEYSIVHLNEDKTAHWDLHIGVGKAGKIYAMVAAQHTGNTVPVMLIELRFKSEYDEKAKEKYGDDYSEDYEVTPDMVDEAIDEKGNIIEGKIPTVAEFVARLITGTFNVKQFGATVDDKTIDNIVSILVNNGEDTMPDSEYSSLEYYIRKALWRDGRGTLHVGMKREGETKWSILKITKNSLTKDGAKRTAELTRKELIAAIATNMHWNTERHTLVKDMSAMYKGLFDYLKKQFKKDPSKTEISLFGIKDLTFNRELMFDENMNAKHFNQISWMIINGKIKTDAVNSVFNAPFVFASGAKSVTPADNAASAAKVASINQGTGERDVKLSTVAAENILKRILHDQTTAKKLKRTLDEMFSTSKEEADKMLKAAGFIDAAILDVPVWYQNDSQISKEDLKQEIDKAIQRYVDEYNKTHEDKILVSDFDYTLDKSLDPIAKSQDLPIIGVKIDGKKILSFVNANTIIKWGKDKKNKTAHPITLTGAYSTRSSLFGKKLDENGARKFVQDALGLTEDQLIITNAILKSVTNKKVYGVTRVAADVINDEARVQFVLSKNGGRGIYFHEAFHYVNLLLHTKEQRQKIYEQYRKRNPFRRRWSDKLIEEHLAENCRKYCLMRTESGVLPWFKKMFSNFLDFAFQYRRGSLIRSVYNNLLEGQYKDQQMDKESLKEFEEAYENEAPMYVPGLRKDVLKNFNAIKTADEFYRCAESLALSYAHFVLCLSLDDTIANAGGSFSRFLKDLESRTEFDRSPYVLDILDNPIAFKYVILGVLRKYGIKGKTKSLKKYLLAETQEKLSESTEKRESEDRYENTWDIDHFELSVKDSVAYRAKLFLSQIPKKYYDEDGDFVPELDELTGMLVYFSYDEAYGNVLENLSDFSRFLDMVDEVSRLSKVSEFFMSFKEQLDMISGDIELECQLATTIKKQTPLIATVFARQKKERPSKLSGDVSSMPMSLDSSMSIAQITNLTRDYDKQLDIINDNSLRPLRSTLRQWSQFVYSSPLFVYDKEYGAVFVSSLFEQIDALYNQLRKKLIKSKSIDLIPEGELESVFDSLKEDVLNLLVQMRIPYDERSLDALIDSELSIDDRGDYRRRIFTIKHLFVDDDTSGSIKFILSLLRSAYNGDEKQLNHKKWSTPRPFNTLYEQYGMDSGIVKLAKAYILIHPRASEHSVKIPGGKTFYPTNENNSASDRIRWTNENFEGYVDKMLSTPYAKHSLILNAAKTIRSGNLLNDLKFVLNLFVGMRDEVELEDQDYFGITVMEDTVSKMLMLNGKWNQDSKKFLSPGMFAFATMADKKTFYGTELISRSNDYDTVNSIFLMPHDVLTYEKSSSDGRITPQRYSNDTLKIFANYFIDELESLKLYYNRDNIAQIVKDKNKRIHNFHGRVSNGRMDFSGNGGLFRYFYDLTVLNDLLGNRYNLNQALEAAYLRQRLAEDPYFGEGVYWIREDDKELDGFELVRRKLQEIEDLYVEDGEATERLYDDINRMLFDRLWEGMEEYANSDDCQLVKISNKLIGNHFKEYIPRAIPRQLLDQYKTIFTEKGVKCFTNNPYKADKFSDSADLALSVIGNYMVQLMISIIELEKIMSGDPSTYKYVWNTTKRDIIVDGTLVQSTILLEKYSDKIKRLGMVLSPGKELRTDYTEEEIAAHPELRSREYTITNIKDISYRSLYLKEMEIISRRLAVVDILRTSPEKIYGEGKVPSEEELHKYIDGLYLDSDFFEEEYKKLSDDLKRSISLQVEKSVRPYRRVNVSDAQVIIRPALYRKIRISLGKWRIREVPIQYVGNDNEVHTTMYSDDIAYNILEKDGSWQTDPEKAAIVNKLEIYPLKMSYSQNDKYEISENNTIAKDIYDKMAIFPAFKCTFNSKVGKQIYDRMNMKDNELDMIAFESAVKVGCYEEMFAPYEDDTSSLENLNDILSVKSSHRIDENGNICESSEKNTMPVGIQNLDNLRELLNTESHKEDERSIGTQMFKILFSNLYDNELYCVGTEKERSGRQIREEIMHCVQELTTRGLNRIKKQFYKKDGKLDELKFRRWINKVLESNDVDAMSREIINLGGTVESLLSRELLLLSAFSFTSKEIIDIVTKGGSAIQLSVFGMGCYDAYTLRQYQKQVDQYYVPNDGRTLRWLQEDGTVEVILSAKFFKNVVPKKYQRTPEMMRQWLIDHDIIKGFKKVVDKEKISMMELLNTETKGFDLSVRASVLLEQLKLTTLRDVVNNEEKIKQSCRKRGDRTTFNELKELLESVNLSFGQELPTDVYSYVENTPKPIGVGYRIPTQGMSSAFAFVCADIIPECMGDVMIVPPEFTSLSGSDFDVDKVFFAMLEFINGVAKTAEMINESNTPKLGSKDSEIRNKLILNYIDILTDKKNLDNARSSIDTITNIIKKEILPLVQSKSDDYMASMTELTPWFLSQRKKEFSVGKDGIGAFALAITNHALTQYSHITLNYGIDNNTTGFKFGDLDEVLGQDRLRISDWLSAMVNAHVDVAKDPYIFDLNINKATYNHVNFLLRAGKGKAALLFIAQPALKRYANKVSAASGMYGGNIDPKTQAKTKTDILHLLLGGQDDLSKSHRAPGYIDALKESFKIAKFESDEQKQYWETRIQKLLDKDVDWSYVFDENAAKNALLHRDTMEFLYFLALCLMAFEEMNIYAQSLSDLVKMSRIDTKKFGNDVILQTDFLNSFVNFTHGDNSYLWKFSSRSTFKPEVSKKSGIIYYSPIDYHRSFVANDNDSLYIFTDNADRTSGTKNINKESEYFKKYGKKKALKYPASTSATIRGLDNAMPITTVKYYNPKLSMDEKRYTDEDLEEYKKIVDLEFEDIYEKWRSGNYKRIVIPSRDWLFDSPLSDIRQEGPRAEIYEYLNEKIAQLIETVGHNGDINSSISNNLALDYYFNQTFLGTKLFISTSLMKDLFKSLLFCATDSYNKLFTTFMTEIFGGNVLDVDGQKVDVYNSVYDKDKVTAIGQALENVMQIDALFKYGLEFLEDSSVDRTSDDFFWPDYEKLNHYSGEIDFTFGGDIEEARYQMYRIMIGDLDSEDPYEQNNVFQNLSELIDDISKNPESEDYVGLSDPNGNLYGILEYLNPVPPTEKIPIPRIAFSKSKNTTTGNEKAQLLSSFEMLLTHPNERVRRIARDVALYAYYSTYNINGSGTFFDLVPAEYRRQFDMAIKEGIKRQDEIFKEFNSAEMLAKVCRNLYFDNDIVPIYKIDMNTKNIYAGQEYSKNVKGTDFKCKMIKGVDGKDKIPSAIITPRAKSKYIKIKVGNNIYLYEKIKALGVASNSSGLVRKYWNAYILVPKLGRHGGSVHQYEFVGEGNMNSIFAENVLPKDFNLEETMSSIDLFIEKSNTILYRNFKVLKVFDLDQVVLCENMLNTKDSLNVGESDVSSGNILDTEQSIEELADVVVDLSTPIKDVIKTVSEQSSDNGVSIALSGIPNITVRKKDIDQFVDELVNLYVMRLDSHVPISQRDLLVNEYKEKVLQVAEELVAKREYENYIVNLFNELYTVGVQVDKVYLSFDSDVLKAAYKILRDDQYDFVSPEDVIIVNKDVTQDQLEDAVLDEQLVLSDEEEKNVDAFLDVAKEDAQTQLSVIQEAELQKVIQIERKNGSKSISIKDPNAAAFIDLFFGSGKTKTERSIVITGKESREKRIEKAKALYGDWFNDDFSVPLDEYELVARNIGSGRNLAWTDTKDGKRGLLKELGFKRQFKGDTKNFETMLAKNGEGIGVDELIHNIWQSSDNLYTGEPRFDTLDIRNALLEILRSALSKDDIVNYDVNNRIRIAKEAYEAEEEHYRYLEELQNIVTTEDLPTSGIIQLEDPNVDKILDMLADMDNSNADANNQKC